MTEEVNDSLIATLKSLKCSICTSILSVAPIMTISDDEYQCGRCKTIKPNDVIIRNNIFERVAQHLNFPCINSSCTEILPWKDVEQHEKDCAHTTIVCPIFHDSCDEQITLKDLKTHMLQKHGDKIFFDQIELTLPMYKSFVCVGVLRSMEFLIYVSSDKVLITSIKPVDEEVTYNLKLNSTVDNHISLVFDNQPIELFNERKHCFRCLDKKCNLKHHPFSSVYTPVVEKLPVENGVVRKDKTNAQSRRRVQFNDVRNPLNDINSPFYIPPRISENQTKSVFDTPGKYWKIEQSPKSATQDNSSALYEPPTTTSSNNTLFSNSISPSVTTTSSNSSLFSTTVSPSVKPQSSTSNEDKPSTKISEIEDQVKGLKCTTFNLAHVQNLIGMVTLMKFTITIPPIEEAQAVSVESYIPRNLLSTIDNCDVLRKILECPICNELMLDKIFVCERGHQICSKCKVLNACNRGTCPSCMGVLADNRCIVLEALAEECSLSCSYKEYGCEFRGNPKNVFKHEKICELRKEE